MATNFVQPGETITFTAPTGGVVSGGAYLIGGLLVVAQADADATEEFEGVTEGVFELAKKTTDDFTEGQVVYWDDSASEFTATATTNYLQGTCVEVTATSAATAKIKLLGHAVIVEP